MSNPKRARRQFTTEQKADVLRRNVIEKVPVSELCNELSGARVRRESCTMHGAQDSASDPMFEPPVELVKLHFQEPALLQRRLLFREA